jgi:hypothetical protein
MASNLIKKSFRSLLFPNVRFLNINTHDKITKNEEEWIKENSKKLLENAKGKPIQSFV